MQIKKQRPLSRPHLIKEGFTYALMVIDDENANQSLYIGDRDGIAAQLKALYSKHDDEIANLSSVGSIIKAADSINGDGCPYFEIYKIVS